MLKNKVFNWFVRDIEPLIHEEAKKETGRIDSRIDVQQKPILRFCSHFFYEFDILNETDFDMVNFN